MLNLQRAGVSTKPAEELLVRMLAKVDGLCAERDRLVGGRGENMPARTSLSSGRKSASVRSEPDAGRPHHFLAKDQLTDQRDSSFVSVIISVE
jgi:hypothetical protein